MEHKQTQTICLLQTQGWPGVVALVVRNHEQTASTKRGEDGQEQKGGFVVFEARVAASGASTSTDEAARLYQAIRIHRSWTDSAQPRVSSDSGPPRYNKLPSTAEHEIQIIAAKEKVTLEILKTAWREG